MSNPDGLVILGLELFSFWDILMLPFNIFGFIGLKYYILLLVLFLVFFSFVSVLSTDDLVSIVDVRPKGFSLLMLIVYILIILAPDLILSSSVKFSVETNILLLLVLFAIGFILGWLSKLPKLQILSHIKVLVIF